MRKDDRRNSVFVLCVQGSCEKDKNEGKEICYIQIICHDGLLRLVFGNVEEAVMQNAKDYLVVTALSIAPLALYNACAGMLRAMNDFKTTMWISILMNIIDISGNAIFIYGVGMGAAGAALATTISRVVAAVIIFCLMFRKDKAIHFVGQITWRFDLQYIKKILYIGVPNSLENSMFQLGKILTISMVSSYGTYAIAANAVCNTLAALLLLAKYLACGRRCGVEHGNRYFLHVGVPFAVFVVVRNLFQYETHGRMGSYDGGLGIQSLLLYVAL